MHILIVTAHPSSMGFTHKLAETYRKGAEKKGHTVEVLDLYHTDLKQDYLNFEHPKMWPDDPARIPLQTKLKGADEWIFIFPIWWGSMPSILKNFLDMNLTSGFAYKKVNNKVEKYMKGKTARVFATCDAAKWMYYVSGIPRLIWRKAVLGFCGVRLKSFDMYSLKNRLNPKTLERVERIAGR